MNIEGGKVGIWGVKSGTKIWRVYLGVEMGFMRISLKIQEQNVEKIK